MDNLKNEIMLFRKAVHMVSVKEEENALACVQELYERHPYSIGILKLYIIILKRINMDKYREKIANLLNVASAIYPDDGELIKYSLDLKYSTLGASLVPEYIKAFHKTLNGLVRLEIQDIVEEKLNTLNNEEIISEALKILPDNKELIAKYIDLVLKSDNLEKVYGLFAFIKEKNQVLGEDYYNYYKLLSGYFVKDSNACKSFADISLCQNYQDLEQYEKSLENSNHTSINSFLLGEILYKKGCTTEAFREYILALDDADDKLKYVLKRRFESHLKILKSSFDYAESITTIDVQQNVEVPAGNQQKAKVKDRFFKKWAEPYGNINTLADVLVKTNLLNQEITGELSVENMERLMDSLNITAEREEVDSFENLDPLKHKVDVPQHYDYNLSEIGDFNE
jgi:hypothetical protein